ncbi:type III restriction endonuclease subunit R [Sphaerisporangium melleum]|uniref:Type III restriction endonuclease subunit R n=1 Tax=Sphaerisporangium melleum TaxID=321316 RepID=A0A917VFJ6_9ACTN|nr:DEAD/DEAH box helicase family protein [Sphaerisporangium melleum]GGK71039.1 type III restriction endonuclease subunit R [Sphaerisporangium melleum]GII70230.1 type III restriction endonuclease subunit R [Sphaerisporangium melleum]
MSTHIQELAQRSPNFGFLLPHEPMLVLDGVSAESHVHTDPDAAMYKARRFTEILAKMLVRLTNTSVRQDDQKGRVHALSRAGVLVPEIRQAFDQVRASGNRAVHTHYGDVRAALNCVKLCFELGLWFHRSLRPGDQRTFAFVPPADPEATQAGNAAEQAQLDQLRAELAAHRERLAEALVTRDEKATLLEAEAQARIEAQHQLQRATADRDRLQTLVEELNARLTEMEDAFTRSLTRIKKPSAAERDNLIARAVHVARQPRTEREVREEVDRMLRAAGWQVQDADRVNLFAGDGVAVREAYTASGPADYLLYADRKLVGVVEAKREGTALRAVERQSARYAERLTASQQMQAWRMPLPFRYETTATETHFTNTLDPTPRSREVFSFHRPETLARWMRAAEEDESAQTFRAKLHRGLPELSERGLRPAQVRAVQGLEAALARNEPRSLIQMATGAGKTYTAVTSSYRLLRHAGAQRVLFLVDRNNLGKQALTEFTNYVTPDDGRKFSDLYNVQRLAGADMLDSSKVVICTVQRLYAMLKGKEIPSADTEDEALDSYDIEEAVGVEYNPKIPPETFDLIIVDECHRSIYGLWRAVIEYFDAFVVGLTATPVAQTFGFFHQNLVSEYTYTEAVADGVNVDFNVFRIRTEIGEQGAVIPEGIVVPKLDRKTRAQRYEELDDDFTYTGRQLGRKVVSKGQLKLVLETFRDRLFTEIFPREPGQPERKYVPKTLIFAVDENHAEEIVAMVRQIFDQDNDFCQKITYTARNPDKLIAAFRNNPELRIAVTVNMIATGTDIKPLECVFFLNEVKSWAMFEQMKGRGARSIDPDELHSVTPDVAAKDRFVLVDAVGVTDSERVDASPLEKHTERQISLERLLKKAGTLSLTLDETSTLASRLARLNKQITPEERAELERLAARPMTEVVRSLARCNDPDVLDEARRTGKGWERRLVEQAVEPLADPELRQRLLDIRRAHDVVYDEVNPDNLLEARGVDRGETAERVVTSWADYVKEHRDELTALEIAYRSGTAGREVYRQLKELTSRLARPPYQWTPDRLWEAYEQVGKAAARQGTRYGAGDLIQLIRFELGLIDGQPRPHRSVIEERFTNWLARQEQAGVRFSPDQVWWLEQIRDVVAGSAVFDHEDLDKAPFTERGGTDGFLYAFGDDRAESLLDDLNRNLTA